MDRFIGILGVIVILGIAYLFSENKKKINWRLVATGLGLQIIFALIILKVPFGRKVFEAASGFITRILDLLLKVLPSYLVTLRIKLLLVQYLL